MGSTPTCPTIKKKNMYSVSRLKHKKLGSVIAISREEESIYLSPFAAFNQAKHMRRLWLEEGEVKVRILIDNQAMTVAQAEKWSSEEYQGLPKCGECGKILSGQVYTHRLCGDRLYCSEPCADRSFHQEMDRLSDEEDIEYL